MPSAREEETFRLLNRDIFLLAVLTAIALGLFFFTRNVAAKQRHLEARVAAIWYEAGERELASRTVEKAIDDLRKATANDRENRKYAFALAEALARANHDAEARQVLLRLRESDPENAEVNLNLARLAAKSRDIPDAVRYYENALYGRWTGSQVDEQRRQVRIELIRFLLAQQQRNRALSELLIVETELPETATSHIQAAELFAETGDWQHALKNFTQAVQLDPHNATALTGAGQAAFQVGDYVKARRYLEAAVTQDPAPQPAVQLLSLVRMIFSSDPLAPHIAMEERQRRLLVDFQQSLQRLENCLAQTSKSEDPGLRALEAEALTLEPELHSEDFRSDPELVRTGLDLIYRIEKATTASCGQPAGLDQALLLIGRKHGGAQ
jgi:tetratricopeptide (TPR) repeat protein